jgi:HNH endonuclease
MPLERQHGEGGLFIQSDSVFLRLLDMVLFVEGGCVEFTGCRQDGYGKMRVGESCRPAHRVSYEELVAPIPQGLTIDHLCRNRRCVNPAHLEPVSNRENIQRGQNATKPACIHGHPLLGSNLLACPSLGRLRVCRACHERRVATYVEANRDAINARRRASRRAARIRASGLDAHVQTT